MMEENFNPYLKWLGIPLADQPPNHYRLLGIPELMDDADVISNSADRQMGHVRNFASGQYAQLSQKLLNEIAAAKVCLLSPAKKAAYDQHLRSLLNTPASPSVPKTRPLPQAQPVLQTRPLPQAVAMASAPAEPELEAVAGNSVTQRVKKKSSAGVLIAGVIGLLLVVGISAWILNRTPEETTDPAESPAAVAKLTDEQDKAEEQAKESESAEQDPVASGSQGDETPASKPESRADAAVADPAVKETSDTGNTSPSDNASDNAPAEKKTPLSVNLLEQIDVNHDAVQGNWKLEGSALISPQATEHAKFMLPGEVPKEYLLEMEVERVAGNNMLFVGLMIAGKQREFYMDYQQPGHGSVSGFMPPHVFPPHPGTFFQNGRPHRLSFHVTTGRVVVSVDGKSLFDIEDRLDEMAIIGKWGILNQKVLYLGSQSSSYRFTKVELTPLDGNRDTSNSSPSDIASDNAPAQKKTQPSVNLLEQMDVARDAVQGRWTLDGNALISPGSEELNRFMLPGEVPQEYLLDMEVERLAGDNVLFLGLMVGGRQVKLTFDYYEQGKQASSSFAPKEDFPQHQGQLLKPGQPHRIRCQVTDKRVIVSVDGETIFDLTDRLDELEMPQHWAIPKKDVLFVGCYLASFRFTKLELTPLETNGSIPHQETNKSKPSLAEKLPIPTGPEMATAQTNLSEIFKEDLAEAKTAKQKRALAQTLFKLAQDETQTPVETFVLLRAARSLAITGADSALVMTVIDNIDANFVVEPLELKAAALNELSKSVETTEDQMALIMATGEVVRQMVEAEQFDQAAPLTKLAQNTAIKTRNVALRKELAVSVKEFDELREAYRKIQPAMETLKAKPDDPEANLAVGKYRAFVQQNWAVGLNHLAASSDAKLRDLAKKDLTGTEDSAEQLAIADAWWDVAEAEASDSQTSLKLRAGFWYRRALPLLTGLTKQKIVNRLEEIRELDTSGEIEPDDWAIWVFDSKRFQISQNPKIGFKDGMISLANNLSPPIVLIYQPFVSDGPFLATMEIKGQIQNLGLIQATGLNQSITSWGPKDQEWHTVTIERLADKSVLLSYDGQSQAVRHWQSDNNMQGKIAVWLLNGRTCTIRRFQLKTPPSK